VVAREVAQSWAPPADRELAAPGLSRPEPGRVENASRARPEVENASRAGPEVVMSKSSDKPKKQQKKKPQKTLKERRSEKRAAKKLGSGSLLRAE
jgi:hypothetical protein